MLGKVCMKIRHDAEHGAEDGVDQKMEKFSIFSKFLDIPFFPFLTY